MARRIEYAAVGLILVGSILLMGWLLDWRAF
jgi:hypothetical protein